MDDDDNTLPNHLFISLRHEFKATRVIDTRLSPTTVKLKTDISTLADDSVDGEEYGKRMEIALAKMSYFVERILKECILIHSENQWAMESFLGDISPTTDNMVVMCPEEPTDAVLCELLLCKFKALTQGAFEFMSIEVESTDGRGMSFLFVGGTPGDGFPENEDWLTDRNYFTKPWWNRPDASTLDIIPDEEDDLSELPAWAYGMGFIADQMASPVQDNVVVRAEFRPKVIDGGRTD